MESENKYYYKVASPEYLRQADKIFNEDLAKQVSGEFDKDHFHHIYQLGYPGELLQAAGFPDDKIEMSSVQLRNKSIDSKHPFDIKALKGLVSSLNDPTAVFVYGSKAKSLNVIIEQEYNDKKFLIGVHFNQEYRGTRISDIRGIHPRDTHEILNWIQQGKLEYVNKDKIQKLIAKQRINPAEVDHLDLDFVAKIIKNFENPNFSMENVMIMDNYYNESLCHPAEIDENQVSAITDTTNTEARKQTGKGWGGLLGIKHAETETGAKLLSGNPKVLEKAKGETASRVQAQSQTSVKEINVEKTLHDNFEELMKESEKPNQVNNLKK